MTALPKTSAPAERAQFAAGRDSLESLTGAVEADLLALHGFGPLAVTRIQAALEAAGLAPLT